MKSQSLKNLPDSPGVYYFLDNKKRILYIGKATSLKDRVKSYFGVNLHKARGPLIVKLMEEARSLAFTPTDSVLEALILEAYLIKKHQPVYNSKEKDDKSFNFVSFTQEDFPKVIITRGSGDYGPFPKSNELKEALKIIRKIFPYRDAKCSMKKPCFSYQVGLCPGVCLPAQAGAGPMTKREYRKRVKHIKLFFEGKKTELIKDLEKEMKLLAREEKFEEANKLKHTLYALDHIQDIALIKRDLEASSKNLEAPFRIEAYDIAHLSGKDTVGVMVVVEDGEPNKSQYRKFKIKVDKNDEINNLKEVLTRRFNHPEWPKPNIVVVDGGIAQLNATKEILGSRKIKIVSVVKDDKHKAREILGGGGLPAQAGKWERAILLANAEAHRFAIGYHRKLRSRGFRI